ncbi:MAG: 2-oxoacid:ferredoxin oxidoreductase subunit beta [Clostridia bacterium]|nr:2-oxoacid:ferredoxin oxidoreductase subunit beta [Clostridia bacterium]
MSTEVLTVEDFRTDAKSWWCPGCGDFGVLSALQKAAVEVGLRPERTVLVAGIGCSGKIGDYFRSYSVHVMHGRTMPVATGIKLANRDLTVIAAGGDGDGYGIGLNHFLHAARRNLDITYIVMDNHIYGLTKGQFSPTSSLGFETTTSPAGTVERPIRPLELALTIGVTYLAQAFSGNPNQMAELIAGGIRHRGFALINCISPCVTYNKVNTYDFYRKSLYNLASDPDYDPSDRRAALRRVQETDELCIGLIYKEEGTPPLEDRLPGFGERPLVAQPLELPDADWEALLAEFS